jgi:hypothetical protein
MRRLSILLALLPVVAAAQLQPKNVTGDNSPVLQKDFATSAAMTYYVATTGNDSNTCTAAAAPCLTIQGAINKIPKLLRQGVTVNVAAGTYAGFVISGFTADNGFQQASGGVLITGPLTPATTLATGTASGIADGGTAGSGSTFGTLFDNTQNWTTNDLVGRFVQSTSTSAYVISSNTATSLSVDGIWTSPAVGSTYTILDPGVVVNTCVNAPASAGLAASASATSASGVHIVGNSLGYRSRAIVIQNLRIAPPTCNGVVKTDGSAIELLNDQIRPTGSAAGLTAVRVSAVQVAGLTELFFDDITINSNSSVSTAILLGSGVGSIGNVRVSNAQAAGVGIALGAASFQSTSFSGMQFFSGLDISGFLTGINMQGGRFDDNTNGTLSSHITCGSSAGVGIQIGASATQPGPQAEFVSVRDTLFATCGTALRVVGPSVADVISAQGSVATTGFDVRLGGQVTYAKAGMALTAGTNEMNIDSGDTVGTFAAGTAGACRGPTTTNSTSRVCAR